MDDYETVKYNHPGDTNVWYIDIKGNEPEWAVNIQPHYEKAEGNETKNFIRHVTHMPLRCLNENPERM